MSVKSVFNFIKNFFNRGPIEPVLEIKPPTNWPPPPPLSVPKVKEVSLNIINTPVNIFSTNKPLTKEHAEELKIEIINQISKFPYRVHTNTGSNNDCIRLNFNQKILWENELLNDLNEKEGENSEKKIGERKITY